MLTTPLGNIELFIDGIQISYHETAVPIDKTCSDLDGRYSVTVDFQPDGKEHFITCRIHSYTPTDKDDIESGENLELKSFYKDTIKLSIGMEGDTEYTLDGKRFDTGYDYDNDYLPDGVQYSILPFTKTNKYVFGIAWLNNSTDKNNVQTWFGADPTMF